jgi:long-subunit fatty acid transport protein
MREHDVRRLMTKISSIQASESATKAVPLAAAIAALWVGLSPVSGHAQSPMSADRGGFAGPAGDSARAVSANPAAMGVIDGMSLDLDHTLKLRSQTAEIDGDEASMFAVQSDPRVAAASDLGTEWLHAGLVGSVPRRYGSDWPTDGSQRFDSIFHRTRGIDLKGALSASPLDWLHVGGSVSFIQAEYRSYRAADMGPIVAQQEGVDPSSVPRQHPGNEGREFLDFSGRTFGWSAGVSLTPGDLRIGAAYHAPVSLDIEGSYELYVPRNDYYQERYGGDINRDATLETRWPDRIEAGAAYQIGDGHEVFANATWRRWSTVDAIDIDVEDGDSDYEFDRREELDLNDTVTARLGGRYRLTPRLAVDATVGFATSPIPDEQLTAEVLDLAEARAAVGARWRMADGVTLRAGYQHVHSFSRTTDPSADAAGTAGTYGQELGLVETSVSFDL